jgi:PPK2 family polyphosphate:nucleotide phosphotransferase
MKTKDYLIGPGEKVDLQDRPTREDGGLTREEGRAEFAKLLRRMQELQEILFAEGRHSLLIVLQAMDAAGKDSTIRHVFGPLNPQGCRVTGFKVPSEAERARDYLWRVHQETPGRGEIRVFNRSHYEDVLIVRVKNLVEEERWRRRYRHINEFERLLAEEGTTIRKFYLHISPEYQKERLQRRLDRPDKRWKFNPADLKERELWPEYRRAFEEALSKCSRPHAPWYVVPAERRWFRDLLVAQVVVETLTGLDLRYPEPDFDPESIVIP